MSASVLSFHVFFCVLVLWLMSSQAQFDIEHCLVANSAGCELGRPPQYMVIAPKRIRANQVFQIFATLLRMEYGEKVPISIHVSIVQAEREITSSAVQFERPSSRIMQLQMPLNAEAGRYQLRVEGRLSQNGSGIVFNNQTDIEFLPKHASLFIQMSKPIYKQEQMVHFRIIPIQPNMMPKYGNMKVYVEDPTGFDVRYWQGLQTNVGGMVSESFQLSDQPRFGTWHIRVDAFGQVHRRPFIVEEFWEPRFDVNVSTPAYVMDTDDAVIQGAVLANHTSGRPCVGNASLTMFFRPREAIWNATKGWEKPHRDMISRGYEAKYIPISEVPVKDYHMYFEYEYRFIDYFQGRINFEWTKQQLQAIAQRGGEANSLVGSEFVVFANVTDWYSDLNRTGWAGTILYDKNVRISWVGGSVRTFKPGARMRVQVAVQHYDGTPVKEGGVVSLTQLMMSSSGREGGSPNSEQTQAIVNGIAQFDLYIETHVTSFNLHATYYGVTEQHSSDSFLTADILNRDRQTIEMKGVRYYSPTKSYITVMTSTDHPMVNEYMIFHVTVSHYVPRIFYQVVSQSSIILADELDMTSRQKTFYLALSREMVPTARIVVYYIREPEEIVTDVLHFFVNGTRHNLVKLELNRGKDFSRDTLEFNAYADPGSYVAFSGMLLDLYSRGLSDGITENKLIDELATYDTTIGSYRQLWRTGDADFEYKFFHGYDIGIDGNTSFINAGLLILTDADVTRIPNHEPCEDQGLFPCFSGIEGDCYTADQRCNGIFDGCDLDGADESGCPEIDDRVFFENAMDRVSRVMRFYDNSSWAWQEIFVKPDGRVDFRVDVPKYPLSWVINGLSISQNLGLGIMERTVTYDATRYMYIQVEHPKSIVWGEQIGIRVTVFNYWYEDDYIEVLITMHGDPNIDMVTVGDMGYTNAYSPPTFKGEQQTLVFLEPGDSRDIYMAIVPSKEFRGTRLSFRVSATCFLERDEYIGLMDVLPNGVSNHFHTPYMIDLIRFPSLELPLFKVVVPELFRKPEVRPNLYVPQSPKAMLTFFGDVAMPGFFENYMNAENVLYRPYGSGEAVTFNFAYTIQTLLFMKSSNQIQNAPVLEVLGELNTALQRIMGYMDIETGGFKMFRDSPKPSLWLTAFVARTLVKATVHRDWERTILIQAPLIQKMVQYICTQQNVTGGFEPDPDEVTYDRKMAPQKKIIQDKIRADAIPLTSYVLIALKEVKDFARTNTESCVTQAIDKAATYLTEMTLKLGNDDVFFHAISAYALSMVKHNEAHVTKLWEMRRNDSDYTYFANSIVYPNKKLPLNNVFYLNPRMELLNDAYAVQSTAYALMAHILTYQSGIRSRRPNWQEERISAVAWLNTMRNSFAGFASTQDTIVAMEALTLYTDVDQNRQEFDITTQVLSTSDPTWTHLIHQEKYNFMRLDIASLPMNKVWGFIEARTRGAGRAMIQLTTTYKVEYEQLMKTQMRYDNDENKDPIPFFTIDDQFKFSGRNDSIMEMTNCVSWVNTDLSMTSGLAVLEVDIPTGYIVMNDTLRDYVRSGIVPNLRRAEFYGRKVVFYFDYLDESKTCVYFRADRWYPVANATREHKIRVYDYYEPGMHRTKLYTTQNLFLLSICFACGSFQCPYCPYFNAAQPVVAVSWSLLYLLTSLMILHRLVGISRR